MPYIQIRSFPKEKEIKERVADKIFETFLDEWGCRPGAVTISFEEVNPDDWKEQVMDKLVAPNEDKMFILSGEKEYESEKKLITGVHHVSMKCGSVDEFDTAVDFYQNLLGLELIRTWGEGESAGAMLAAEKVIIEIFASGKVADTTGSVNHFAFVTDDVDYCLEMVKAAGYEITVPAKDVEIPSEPPMAIRCGFCRGPVGEEIEFFCEK